MDLIVDIILEVIMAIAVNEDVKKTKNAKLLESKLEEGIPEKSKEAFLLLVLLMYLFYKNDGVYSLKEKRLMNKELKHLKTVLIKSNYNFYKSISDNKYKMDDITDLIIKQDYNQITIRRVLRKIKNLLESDKTYVNAIAELENILFNLV